MLTGLVMAAIRDARPALAPGKMAAPAPKIFKTALPRPENALNLTAPPRGFYSQPRPAPPRIFFLCPAGP